jgi:hypothetical protein
MRKLGMILAVIGISSSLLTGSNKANRTPNPTDTGADLRPSAEMQRLLDAFRGDWTVSESFEVSESRQGRTRQGTASFRAGPGFSLIEDYKSNGSAGELNFLALLWWDESAKVYRLLTCANNDGCEVRGTAQWEGNRLVNSWDEEINGKKVALTDSFEDISPSGFRLVSEGSADGKIVWRVITKYTRKDSHASR